MDRGVVDRSGFESTQFVEPSDSRSVVTHGKYAFLVVPVEVALKDCKPYGDEHG